MESENRTETKPVGPDALDGLLLESGVDFGRPEKRRERAVRLFNEGCTVEDLDELVQWAHGARKKLQRVGSYLEWMTKDQARWKACVQQIREQAARHKKEQAANEPVLVERKHTGDERIAWLRGMAYARVRTDRADPAQVASELQLTMEELQQLIDEEATRRGPVVVTKRQPEVVEEGREAKLKALRDRIRAQEAKRTHNEEIW